MVPTRPTYSFVVAMSWLLIVFGHLVAFVEADDHVVDHHDSAIQKFSLTTGNAQIQKALPVNCFLSKIASNASDRLFTLLGYDITVANVYTSILMVNPTNPPTMLQYITGITVTMVETCIFILLSRETNQCPIRARLGTANHLSTTPRWSNPIKCLSQRHK